MSQTSATTQLADNQTQKVNFVVNDKAGQPIANPVIAATSSDTTICDVDTTNPPTPGNQSLLLVGKKAGSATVRATCDEAICDIAVTVTASPADSINPTFEAPQP